MKRDIAQEITNQIIALIEAGQTDGTWQAPWVTLAGAMPCNAFTGVNYRGINTLLLWHATSQYGYTSSQWATFNRWKTEGYKLSDAKGRGQLIVFWQRVIKEDRDTGEVKAFPILKSYIVFNADHAVNLETGQPFSADDAADVLPDQPDADGDWLDAQTVLDDAGADLVHGGNRACYNPSRDQVHMPMRETFKSLAAYYCTGYHELAHWTGHDTRLSRNLSGRFGSEAYAAEELIAELAAAFTAATVGIDPVTRVDHAKYISSWLRVLRNDKRAIITAAGHAQRASDYILGHREPVGQ